MACAGLTTVILSQIFPPLSQPFLYVQDPSRVVYEKPYCLLPTLHQVNNQTIHTAWGISDRITVHAGYEGTRSQLFLKLRMFTPLCMTCIHCIAMPFCLFVSMCIVYVCSHVYIQLHVHVCIHEEAGRSMVVAFFHSSLPYFGRRELTQFSWIG